MATQDKPASIEFYGGYQVYSESGIDLTLLWENLRRSIEHRWENNRRSAAFIDVIDQEREARLGRQPLEPRRPFMFDPAAVLRRLSDHHVEFVVIGGLAMISHGSAYITKDLDICYSRTPQNLAALAAAFASLHPYLRGVPPGLPFRFDVPTLQAGLNFTLTTDLGDVDILGEVSGIGSYNQVLAQSEEHVMFGLKVRVLSIDGLIAAKKAAGRLKDRNHILELEELKKMRDAQQGGN